MSTTDIDLLGPAQTDDILHPEFAVVLRGFDPEEVRAYVGQVAYRVDAMQRELHDARGQLETARRQYAAAKEAAYKQLAAQMTELLHTADQEAERFRREGSEEARRTTGEAEHAAAETRREAGEAAASTRQQADEHAEAMRREGDEMLGRARSETDRILGGLATRRDQMLSDMEATRNRLSGVLLQLDDTIGVTRQEAETMAAAAAREADERSAAESEERRIAEAAAELRSVNGIDPTAERTPSAALEDEDGPPPPPPAPEAPGTGNLLDSVEGFEVIIPDIRIDDDDPDL